MSTWSNLSRKPAKPGPAAPQPDQSLPLHHNTSTTPTTRKKVAPQLPISPGFQLSTPDKYPSYFPSFPVGILFYGLLLLSFFVIIYDYKTAAKTSAKMPVKTLPSILWWSACLRIIS